MKPFIELYKTDVADKVESKEGASYLSWAFAWAEVKKVDEKANYTIYENQDGLPFFVSPFGIDVKVGVQMSGVEHIMRLPVLDNKQKPMKTEAYKYSTKKGEYTVQAADSFDINKAIMRCLVKAIAMHGIGLYIYAGEDLPSDGSESIGEEQNASKSEIKVKLPYIADKQAWKDADDELCKTYKFRFDKESRTYSRTVLDSQKDKLISELKLSGVQIL